MSDSQISAVKKVHFIGIGGISMSAIALVLLDRGFAVTGSDFKESEILDSLRNAGAKIFIGQRAENITPDLNLVVYTAAIHSDNPEIQRTKELGIPLLTRAEFLGGLMKNYREAICVAGTHGKTTTTSLLSKILVDADTDPTIMVGGMVSFLNGNLRIGKNGPFLTESCEYTNSFLSFFPTIAVILNVKADHLDFFKDLDDIRASFRKFAHLLPDSGKLVINGEIDNLDYFISDLDAEVITFGLKGDFDYTAKNISYNQFACPMFDIYKENKFLTHVSLNIPGEHNIYNCLAAVAVAGIFDISPSDYAVSVSSFMGVDRRFQLKGVVGGATIIDDYAHHPDEIKATLSAALNYPHKKLWCVFQPHTYTRTKALMDEFADALQLADAVILADIYAARETDNLGISSDDLGKKIAESGKEVHYIPTFDEIEDFLLENLVSGDMLITMGAGDVVIIGEKLLGK